MFRLAFKGVVARKLRLVLTGLAIILGVAFAAGAFVFSHTLQAGFNNLFGDLTDEVDVAVVGESEFGMDQLPVPASVLDDIRELDGVRAAFGDVAGWALPLVDGDPVVPDFAPAVGMSWPDQGAEMSPWSFTEGNGRAPEGPAEVAIDVTTADNNDLVLGDRIEIELVEGVEEYTIVGFASVGDAGGGLLGSAVSIFDLDTARRVFDFDDEYVSISVAAEGGVSQEELSADIAALLPAGITAVTGAELADDQAALFDEMGRILQFVLLPFAGLALLVGTLLIFNTFSIIVSQRTRELALLRAAGATGRQVRRLVMAEALLVGVTASATGIAAGVGLAAALRWGIERLGPEFPPGALTLKPSTVVYSMLAGTIITLLAAYLPARAAARVPPAAALRDYVRPTRRASVRRLTIGVAILVASVACLSAPFLGASGKPAIALGVTGVVGVFLSTLMLAPLLVTSFVRVVAAPLRAAYGVTGHLAEENARRQPRRTAATASALMLGLAAVSLFAVFGSSVKTSIAEAVETGMAADFQVEASLTSGGLSPDMAARLAEQPEIAVASPLRHGTWLEGADAKIRGVTGVDPETLGQVYNLDMAAGSLADLRGDAVILHQEFAEDLALGVGDTVEMAFPVGGVREMEVVGVFAADISSIYVLDEALMAMDEFEDAYYGDLDDALLVAGILVGSEPGVAAPETRAAVERIAAEYPNSDVNDRTEVIGEQQSLIDIFLIILTGMLALSIVIALFGVANTIALSIYERTREFGLLRAVGTTRRQVRRMIRWEALLMGMFGGVLGLVVGTSLGWVLVASDDELTLTLPVGQLLAYLIAACVGAVLASLIPAFRSGRVDVLDAIAYE